MGNICLKFICQVKFIRIGVSRLLRVQKAWMCLSLPLSRIMPPPMIAASRSLGKSLTNIGTILKVRMVNAIRTRKGITDADVVVVRFGEKYKQWNAAFDAGYAAALGKSLIILHQDDHQHALKEVDAAALAVCKEPQQVAEILRYVLNGTLPA